MPISKEELIRLYRTMLTIRRFEEQSYTGFGSGDIPGLVHSYVCEEACATGVCSALRRDDKITSTHRGHGHCIAKGADIKRMMAEIYGRGTGLCKGKGGSMHIADFNVGMLGADYDGYFPHGDAAALARLLEACRAGQLAKDPADGLLGRLATQCALRAPLFAATAERGALIQLLHELERP